MTRHDIEFITRQDGTYAVIIQIPDGLGIDGLMVDWFDTVLWAMGRLRSGAWDAPEDDSNRRREIVRELYRAIHDVDRKLTPRLKGLGDALIRRHYLAGGSHGALALALDSQRSTAQSRRNRLPETPSHWESWARGELPTDGHAAPAPAPIPNPKD